MPPDEFSFPSDLPQDPAATYCPESTHAAATALAERPPSSSGGFEPPGTVWTIATPSNFDSPKAPDSPEAIAQLATQADGPPSASDGTGETDTLKTAAPGSEAFGDTLKTNGSGVFGDTLKANGSGVFGEEEEASPEEAPAPPKALYTFQRLIGRGGMGEVWEARQESLGRMVAVKRIRADSRAELGSSNPGALREMERDFRREASVAARLDHPGIAPVHDLGADPEGSPLLAMKLVRGDPWNEVLKRDFAALSEADFLAKHIPVLIDVAHAAGFAHSRGVVHRDIKPSQVMVGGFGETLLIDWGLAVRAGDGFEEGGGSRALGPPLPEEASSPAGTPALMAPEQTDLSASRVGPWTDVYLLGGTLYYMLAGSYPHSSGSSVDSMRRARAGKVEPPEVRAPGRRVPPELSAIAMKCLSPRPEDRYPTGCRVVEALQEHLAGAERDRKEMEEQRARSRESIALAREVKESLKIAFDERVAPPYEELSACAEKLGRAAVLCRRNPAVAPLRQGVLEAYAERAVADGDLIVARLQAERLLDGKTRARVLAKIDAAQADIRQGLAKVPLFTRKRMLGLGLLAAVGLAFLAVIEALVYDALYAQAQDRARGMAIVAAQALDPAALDRVGSGPAALESPDYLAACAILEKVHASSEDILGAMLFRPVDPANGRWEFLATPDPVKRFDLNGDGEAEILAPGTPFDFGSAAFAKALEAPSVEENKGAAIGRAPTPAEARALASYLDQAAAAAYAPVKNPETGKTVAVVSIDISTKKFDEVMAAIVNGASSLLIVMLIVSMWAMICSFKSRRALEAADALDREIKSQLANLRDKDVTLA